MNPPRKKNRPAGRKRAAAEPASASASVPAPVSASPAPAHRTGLRLPAIAKGRRPVFYPDPALDQLFAIVTALTGEISVLFDRLDTLQRLLDAAGVLPARTLAGYVPDEPAAAERAVLRDELLRRVFAVLEVYAAGKAAPAS